MVRVRALFPITALSVCLLAQQPPATPTPPTKPCPVEEGDTGAPKLRRGKPAERRPVDCEPASTPIPLPPEPRDPDAPIRTGPAPDPKSGDARNSDPDDDRATPIPTLIDKARLKAQDYTASLPNFICEQLIRRMEAKTYKSPFKLRDTVTVDVFFDGKEDYRNAKRNGKPLKDYDDIRNTGSWSSGEYGSILNDLLSPVTNAEFVFKKKETIEGIETEQYDYVVLKANSHWTISFDNQSIKPSYKGRVWINPADHHLLRLEMQARALPNTFPVDHAEMTLDYGPVKIAGQSYTLPIKTANLSCFRYKEVCTQNETEFRNYRKFTTESTISTTETNITFDGDEKKPETPPPAAKTSKPAKKKK